MKRYKTIFSSFHSIYRFITTLSDLKTFLTGVCRIYRNSFQAAKVIIICRINGPASHKFLKIRLENKKQMIKSGGVSILTRREKEMLKQQKEMLFNNMLIAPLIFTDILGAIYATRKSGSRSFDPTEKRWFLSLCEEVGTGLEILSLYREQHKIMLNYIKSLSSLLTQYVPTSYLNKKVVSSLIKVIGKELKLSQSEIDSLRYASILHDAGKIKLPSHLLSKQKPLTTQEFKLITKHPRKGVELIKNLNILKPVIPIILHHHERFNGKGYPSRLKGENIPLGSRILAVLDSFDAMYFGRPYKKKLQIDEIEKELKDQRGQQFDPKIVDLFLKILKRKNIQHYLKLSSTR